MLCHLHYSSQPCNDCACEAFLRRAGLASSRSTAPAVITFRPAVFEHIYAPWETPRVIDTPQELLRETARRGLESEYLRDSSLWRSRPPKEW